MDLLKILYEVLGASWPRLSIGIAALIGAILFGGGWWLIGKQYEKQQATTRSELSVSTPSRTPAPAAAGAGTARRVEQMGEAGYAWLTVVQDSLGNRNENSWGKGQGGAWSHGTRTTVRVTEKVRFSAQAISPRDDLLQFHFALQPAGGGFQVRQDWSSTAEWTWVVKPEDIGRNVVIKIAVRRPKNYYQFGNADDYTYATYDVLPPLQSMVEPTTDETTRAKDPTDTAPTTAIEHAWSEFQASVCTKVAQLGIGASGEPVVMPGVFWALARHGLLTDHEARTLDNLRNLRNNLVHGAPPPPISAAEAAESAAVIRELANLILARAGLG